MSSAIAGNAKLAAIVPIASVLRIAFIFVFSGLYFLFIQVETVFRPLQYPKPPSGRCFDAPSWLSSTVYTDKISKIQHWIKNTVAQCSRVACLDNSPRRFVQLKRQPVFRALAYQRHRPPTEPYIQTQGPIRWRVQSIRAKPALCASVVVCATAMLKLRQKSYVYYESLSK